MGWCCCLWKQQSTERKKKRNSLPSKQKKTRELCNDLHVWPYKNVQNTNRWFLLQQQIRKYRCKKKAVRMKKRSSLLPHVMHTPVCLLCSVVFLHFLPSLLGYPLLPPLVSTLTPSTRMLVWLVSVAQRRQNRVGFHRHFSELSQFLQLHQSEAIGAT